MANLPSHRLQSFLPPFADWPGLRTSTKRIFTKDLNLYFRTKKKKRSPNNATCGCTDRTEPGPRHDSSKLHWVWHSKIETPSPIQTRTRLPKNYKEQRTKKGQVPFSASWASSQGLAIHRSDYPLQRREARAGRDRSSLPSLKSCDSKAMNHRETTSRHSFPKQCQK